MSRHVNSPGSYISSGDETETDEFVVVDNNDDQSDENLAPDAEIVDTDAGPEETEAMDESTQTATSAPMVIPKQVLKTRRGHLPSLKVIIVGESGVGKTCLLQRFRGSDFNANAITTVGTDGFSKTVKINEKLIKLDVWDTAGQERFRSIVLPLFRDTMGVVFVYSVNEPYSNLEKLNYWIAKAHNHSESAMKILVGNKTDLDRRISFDEGMKFAKKHGMMFMETSAKTSTGVDEIFEDLAFKIVQNCTFEEVDPERVKLDDKPHEFLRRVKEFCC